MDIRKIVTTVEEIRLEAGRAVDPPIRRVVTAAVLLNPFSGRYEEDLTPLVAASVEIGRTISEIAVAALGGSVHSYGKGGIVGTKGELEHVAAMLHPEFGAPLREAVDGGKAIIPSAKKRGGPGATLDTGDIRPPIANGDTIVVRDGRIASVGDGAGAEGISTVIDAAGATVMPGLCDDHTHPVLGDYTPRQQQLDWIDSYLHGGVTTMLSAGEPHLPGRPTDPPGLKALAIFAQGSFANLRPSGVKVHAGAVLLEEGLTEADFAEMAAAGVHLIGEIGISGVKDPDTAAQMARWAQANRMNVMVHTDGASIPGSGIVGADFVVTVKPDVAAHVNGGPTALPVDHVERILEETDARVEVVHNGNVKAAGEVAALVARRGELHRLVLGTDSPAGSGVQPLGMLRVVSWVSALGGVEPSAAVAAATGNAPPLHRLNVGVISPP